MGYVLGVDLGTTWTAAAIARDGRPEMLSLGNRGAAIPSVLFLSDDGPVVGDAANRRAITDPTRVAREFKRRIGDPTPLLVGGTPKSAESLMATLLRSVVQIAAEREGGAPDHVAVSHPANWGPYKLDLLREALRLAEQPTATVLTEPEAAALSYASAERVPVGAVIAVYDLGGGTFDVALLRKIEGEAFEILGTPEGIERLGGVDFDEAVFGHVVRAIEDDFDELDPDDPETVAAVARLRQECVAAKEALSDDTSVTIPVNLPGISTSVPLSRAEFEALIRPALEETIPAMRRAFQSAGVSGDDLFAVLLVGGSSRMPLVARLVGDALGQRVATDVHPKHSVALGAAIAARADLPNVVTRMTNTPSKRVITTGPGVDVSSPRRKVWPAVAAVALVAAVAGGAFLALGGDDPDESAAGDTTATSAAPTTSTSAPATDLRGEILGITLAKDPAGYPVYSLAYTWSGFDPSTDGLHLHFYWDTQTLREASPEGYPDSFWGEPFTYSRDEDWTGFNPDGKPEGATAICVVVAKKDHRVLADTGNCFPLPPS